MGAAALAMIEEILDSTEDAVFDTSESLAAFGFDPLEKSNYQDKVNRVNKTGKGLRRV